MIANNTNNVDASFEILLEELELEIDFVLSLSRQAFEKRDFDRTKEAVEQTNKLTAFHDKITNLRKEWKVLSASLVEAGEQETKGTDRQDFGRLQRGVRTPQNSYREPILRVLNKMGGGSARVPEVLKKVKDMMKNTLKEIDYESISSVPDMPRWQKAAEWERHNMVIEGLLKSDSPRGVWEISDEGRKFLNN